MMGRLSASASLLLIALSIAACSTRGDEKQVDLSDRVEGVGVHISGNATPSSGVLRIAIAGVMSPSRTLDAYDQLIAYMRQRLGVTVTVDQRSSYAEVNDLVRNGQADLAFVCSRAYLEGQEQFGMELFLAPEVSNSITYYSYLVVPANSPANGLLDLRGKAFAFSDPLSNSGRLVAEYQLYLMKETPNSFFRRYEYTGSHDKSVLAVADRLVDGAAVDSLVYDYIVARNPEIGARTKVIARWGPYGIPPLVVPPNLDPALRERVRRTLLEMDQDTEGVAALAALGVDRFVPIDDSAYDSIREMVLALKGWAR